MKVKIAALAKYSLEWWWIDSLLQVIDKFVSASVDGESDAEFWNAAV